MSLTELQEVYLDYLRNQRRSLSTVGLNRRWLGGFLEFCASQGVTEAVRLTPGLLPAYHEYLLGRLHNRKGRRYSPNSLYQMLYILRAFLRWTFIQGHVALDLSADVAMPRLNPTALLAPADLEALYLQAGADPLGLRDAALVAVFHEAQLELEQALRLDLEAIRLVERRLLVRQSGEVRIVSMGKGLTWKLAVYLEEGRAQLSPPADERAVFLNRSGQRLSAYAVQARLRAMGERAGLSQTVHPRLLARSGQAHSRGGPDGPT